MVKQKKGSHEGMALVSDAPSARVLDLGDKTMHVKPLEKPGDAGRLSAGLGGVAGGGEQVRANVPVGEAAQKVFPAHDGCEEADVGGVGRIETPVGTFTAADGLGQGMDLFVGRRRIAYPGQGIQVPSVGGPADLDIAVEIGHALGHGEPAHDSFTLADAPPANLELRRTVDGRLDPQYAPMFVVHFDPVLLYPVADACARPPSPAVIADIAGEVPVELSTEEGHDILGAEADRGVLQQSVIKARQSGGGFEHHVGGVFSLLGDPVVIHASQQIAQERIDPAGKGCQHTGPVLADEAVGQTLSTLGIVDGDEGVIPLAVADTVAVEQANRGR